MYPLSINDLFLIDDLSSYVVESILALKIARWSEKEKIKKEGKKERKKIERGKRKIALLYILNVGLPTLYETRN